MRRLASSEARLSIRTRGCKRRPAMKKSSKKQYRSAVVESKPEKVVGLDLGDRHSHYCILTSSGEAFRQRGADANCAGGRDALTLGEPVVEGLWSSGDRSQPTQDPQPDEKQE